MFKGGRLKQFVTSGLLLFVLLMSCAPNAWASSYGKATFGSCAYQTGCQTAQASTQTTLPGGLKISVNLVNGQSIPKSGYLIIVTPLNGRGASFKQVNFYINNKLAQTVVPDETGTAQWFWEPSVYEGTQVTIVVTGTDGNGVTENFQVKIVSEDTTAATRGSKKPDGISSIFSGLADNTGQVINKIPKPIAYSIPYILFVLLAIYILLLVAQARRELKEYRTLQAVIERKQSVAQSKKTFMELISHYLRTPLAIIEGGIDALRTDPAGAIYAGRLRAIQQSLSVKIEKLVGQTHALEDITASGRAGADLPFAAPWRSPGLYLPPILIAAAVAAFNYLANRAGALDVSQTNLIIQALIFTGLLVAIYLIFRNRQLRKRDSQKLKQLAEEESAANQARDGLISDSVRELGADIKSLDELTAQITSTAAGKFIRDGQNRLHDLLNKFIVAKSLQGGHSTAQAKIVRLSSLIATSSQILNSEMGRRGITLLPGNEVSLTIQNPELLAFVLRSLLDNAVSYSPDNGTIEITAIAQLDGTAAIQVTDHGTGLTPEQLKGVFQPFFKAESAELFNHQGMGFNLYLDKLIMAYLGGDVMLSSLPGKGTTATIRLPRPNNTHAC